MYKLYVLIGLFVFLIASPCFSRQPVDPYAPDPNPPREITDMKLVWSDEFNIEGKPDPKNWKYEKGFVRNQELQWYQPENVNCKGGLLVIEGKHEQVLNPKYQEGSTDWKKARKYAEYTSSSIISQKLREFQYGRFEIRARIDTTMGSWPAIWTKGITGKWPYCGEIDIMEFYRDKVGGVRKKPILLANVAWGHPSVQWGAWDTRKVDLKYFTDQDPDWCNKFHVWRMDWDENEIKLYLDDELLNTTSLKDTKNPEGHAPAEPHKQKHFILLNLAIGSNGGKPVPANYPIKYEVDYVRVYQPFLSSTETVKERITRIYPNPVIDFLYIESAPELSKISVCDPTGYPVMDASIQNGKVDLSGLQEGFYIINIAFRDGSSVSKRILKKR